VLVVVMVQQKPTFGYLSRVLLVLFFESQVPGGFYSRCLSCSTPIKAFHELDALFWEIDYFNLIYFKEQIFFQKSQRDTLVIDLCNQVAFTTLPMKFTLGQNQIRKTYEVVQFILLLFHI